MKNRKTYLFKVKYFDKLPEMEIVASSYLDAMFLSGSKRIENGQHTDFDYIKDDNGNMVRPHFDLVSVVYPTN